MRAGFIRSLNVGMPSQERRIRRVENNTWVEEEMICELGVAFEMWMNAVQRWRDERRKEKEEKAKKKQKTDE